MPDPEITAGTPVESPAEAALVHTAPDDASATQAELDAHINETLDLPTPKTETPDAPPDIAPDRAPDAVPGTDTDPASGGAVGDEGEKPAPEPTTPVKPEQKPGEAPKTEITNSLEVEDADGKKYQISSVDDLPEDFAPKNNRQVLKIISDLSKLEGAREQQATQAAQVEAEAAKQAKFASWDAEIAALQGAERLSKPKAAPGSPEFINDPAVQRVEAVFKFMAEENARRAQVGAASIQSFNDALNAVELQEYRAAEVARTKAETQTAKAKSGVIGRTSAASGDMPVYVAGQARDIWDL